MLKEHFRCVEPIIRFSMDFYPEKMLPLRVPAAHERLGPTAGGHLPAARLASAAPEGQRGGGGRDRQRDRVADCRVPTCRSAPSASSP